MRPVHTPKQWFKTFLVSGLLAFLIIDPCTAAPPLNTTSDSTLNFPIWHTNTVDQQVNTFSTELIAQTSKGTVVFDQTFKAAVADPTVQAAITQAENDITTAGDASFNGPALTSNSNIVTGVSSVLVTNILGVKTYVGVMTFIGPATVLSGDLGDCTNYTLTGNYAFPVGTITGGNPQTITVVPGGQDVSTRILSIVTNQATITTTTTNLSAQVYQLTGIAAQADLNLNASTVNGTYALGSNIVFTVTVTNLGPNTTTGVVISNRIPAYVNFVSATGGAAPVNGVLLLNLGTLAAGAADTVQVIEQATQQLPMQSLGQPTGQFTNRFQVSANENDPVPANNSASVVAAVATAVPGTPFNIGPFDASNPGGSTVITGEIVFGVGPIQEVGGSLGLIGQPGDLVFLNDTNGNTNPTNWVAVARFFNPADPTGTNGLTATESQAFFATNFNGGGFAGFKLFPQVDFMPAGTVITSNGVTTIVTTYDEFGPAGFILPGQLDINVVTMVSPFTDVSLMASAAPEPVGVGGNLVYTLTVSNALLQYAPQTVTATGVTISNRIPANCTFVSATGGATPSGGVLLMNLGSLPEGTNTTVQVVVHPTGAGKLTNNFQVFANEVDPNLTNNATTVVSTVTNGAVVTQADLAITMQSSPNPVNVGAPLTFTLSVTNKSVTTAPGVVVSNTLPAGATFLSALPSQGTATNKSGIVIGQLGSLAHGVAASLAIVVTLNSTGPFTNMATVSSAISDPVPANNVAQIIPAVVSVPITNLQSTTLTGPTLDPDTGLYEQQVEVSNGGPLTPSSVLLLVSGLPSGATLYNATGKTNGIPYVQSMVPLGVGSNIIFTLEYYVLTRVTPAGLTFTVIAGPAFIPPAPSGTTMAVTRTVMLQNGNILVEFSALIGQAYAVQYSSDMITWHTAVPAITAGATRVEWIDAGPPQTDSSPATAGQRFYRVVLLNAK